MKVPDYAEPIDAWRAWLIVVEDGQIRLSSLVYRDVWPARRELEAVCRRRVLAFPRIWKKRGADHAGPSEKCGCGIYGVPDPGRAATYVAHALWRDEALRWPLLHRAIGRVFLWGTVVECEAGWRASHAYPHHVYLPERGPDNDGGVEPAALVAPLASYGVPVELIDCDLASDEAVLSALPVGVG